MSGPFSSLFKRSLDWTSGRLKGLKLGNRLLVEPRDGCTNQKAAQGQRGYNSTTLPGKGSRMASAGAQPQGVIEARSKFFFTDSGARTFVLCLFLVIPTLAVYYPVHTHPFFGSDDALYVVNTDALHHGVNWKTIYWSFRTLYMVNWIPLTWLSHALYYSLFGLNPAGHHMVNVLLHAFNAVLLFLVLKHATGYAGRSFMVAALFALHPMNVEPVVWVAELKTMLSMVFFLLALGAYGWYARVPRVSRYLLVALLFGIGLMAKPQIITLPFVLLLWDYWPLRRMVLPGETRPCSTATFIYPVQSISWLIKEKIPLLFLCGMDALLTMKIQSGWKFKPPLPSRLANAAFSYWLYVRKFFWPSDMAPFYPHLGGLLSAWQLWSAILFLAAITVLVVKERRHRYLPVGWFWFLGTLIPNIGLMQVGLQGMADRYAYVSYLGLFIMVCWGVSDWKEQRRVSVAWVASASAVVVLVLTVVTFRQIGYWQDDFTLWEHGAKVIRHNWVAEDNLGAILMNQGKRDEAIAHFLRAAAINPTDSLSNIQIAVDEQKRGNLRETIACYQRALHDGSLAPEDRVKVWINLAVAYRDLGDTGNARQAYDHAMQLRAEQ